MTNSRDESLPLPLLITGVAGVAGYNALAYFQAAYPGQVIGIRQQDNWPLSRPGIEACNAEDRDTLSRLFDRYQFRSVLNCAGNCALRACELDTRLAWRTNVEGLLNILSIVAEREVRLVHMSVDLVFAGRQQGGYTEDDTPDPVTVYGKTMVAAEWLLVDWMPSACIVADLVTDGHQLQRSRRSDRLDSIAIPEGSTGHALLRRGANANLHRLSESRLRARPVEQPDGDCITPADRDGCRSTRLHRSSIALAATTPICCMAVHASRPVPCRRVRATSR